MCTFDKFSEILLWSLVHVHTPSADDIEKRWHCDRATAYRHLRILMRFRSKCWNAGIRDLTRPNRMILEAEMSKSIQQTCARLQMNATAKSTLMATAYFADDKGFSSPSIPTLCTLTCLSARTIHNAIHYLEDVHLLKAYRSRGRRTRYLLTAPIEPELHETDSGSPEGKVIHNSEKDIPSYRSRCTPKEDIPPQQMQLTPAFLAVVPRDFCVKPPQQLRSKKNVTPFNKSKSKSKSKSKKEKEKEKEKDEKGSLNGSRLCNAWTPSDEDQQWAQRKRPDLDTTMEIIKFRNYWTNVCTDQGIKHDWSLAWQNWILQAHKVRSSDTGIVDAGGQALDAIEVLEKIAHGSMD